MEGSWTRIQTVVAVTKKRLSVVQKMLANGIPVEKVTSEAIITLQERRRLSRVREARRLVTNLRMRCLIRSCKRCNVRPTYRL